MQDYIHICSNMNVCIAFNEYAKVLMRIKMFKAGYETLYLHYVNSRFTIIFRSSSWTML